MCLDIWQTCSSHTATDRPTIRSRDFRIHTRAPPALGYSRCQNVNHIRDKTMTLCNILRIWALISRSDTAWLCMTLSRWGKSCRKDTFLNCQLPSESWLCNVWKMNRFVSLWEQKREKKYSVWVFEGSLPTVCLHEQLHWLTVDHMSHLRGIYWRLTGGKDIPSPHPSPIISFSSTGLIK